MNIGKKVAVLTVAAGALVLGSAAGASAHGGGFNPFGTVQTNECYTGAGAIIQSAVAAPSGDVNIDSNCLNFTNGTAAVQSNECGSGSGPITSLGGAAPTGKTSVESNCTNIALGNDPYSDQSYGNKSYGGHGHGF